jgi:hypothetical protein
MLLVAYVLITAVDSTYWYGFSCHAGAFAEI